MNGITVKIALLGGLVKEVFIDANSSMDTALSVAGVDGSGKEIKVNGRTPCGTLYNGDIITVAPKVKGGAK